MRPPPNRASASAAAGTPANAQTSWPCSARPGTSSGRDTAPSAITRWSASKRPIVVWAARLPGWISVISSWTNVIPCSREQRPRPAPFGDRPETDEHPQLAQPHPEVRVPVDEDDLVVVAEEPLQLDCRRDAAEAAAEDEGARAHVTPGCPVELELAQLDPADLAGQRLRQVGDELDQPRVRVGGEPLAHEALDLVGELVGRLVARRRGR